MKKMVVLGAGISGVGTALLAKAKGYEVFVSDKGKIADKYQKVLLNNEIEFEELMHSEDRVLSADLVMKSPGIPDGIPLVQELLKKMIPVISEIEFAAEYTNKQLVAITGTNGKTTTTMLTQHLLSNGGINTMMVGNIGESFAESVVEDSADMYVLEISSFQLDGIVEFAPHIAVLTNISPDHLDRYDYKFEKYVDSKFRITMNQKETDYFIYNADDEVITSNIQSRNIKAQLIPFSTERVLESGVYVDKDKTILKIDNSQLIMPTSSLTLEGKHNIKNAMAASAVAQLLRIRKDTIRECLENFQGAEHRLEHFLKINKVQYINDSKATNVNATYFALESMDAPTVWIVGGVDKGNDYQSLFPFVNEKVKAIICLGVENQKLLEAFSSMVPIIVETQFMSEAVKIAYKVAESGDNVLLSPACASFDLFENYEDRGRQFKEAVRKL